MYPMSNQKLFLCMLQAILLSEFLPGFLCADRKGITYGALNSTTIYANCSGEPFSCGSIRYISYPFWGGSRPRSCGRTGYELVCQSNIPMLSISSLSYRVQEIDFNTNTLKVAREDLWNTTCPKTLHNTTMDLGFYLSSNSKDENVTLFFDCTDDDQTRQLPNQFSCNGSTSTAKTINIFEAGSASFATKCKDNIVVPVNQDSAQSLEDPTESSINILQSALASGFSIQWVEDPLQRQAPFCNAKIYASCLGTGGKFNSSPAWGRPIAASNPAWAPSPSPEEPQGSDRGHPHIPAGIILGVVLGVIGIFIGCSVICYFLKQHRSPPGPNQESNQDVENFLLKHGSLTPKRYKYFELKKITKSFSDKLGQGGYGCVYKGTLPDGSLVAVKVLIDINSNGEEFINEVASISRTSHVNIVNLLGFCFDRNKRALVYEFMPNKSLDKFISSNVSSDMDCPLDLEKLYKIAVGVAKGLEYLHTGCSTRIVHFDIKPQNILLDDDFCPKISDFGLAKLCKKKQSILSMIGARGTIGYMAPEVFSRNFGGVSHKSDVYSYGMMVLEMAGARKIEEAEVVQSSENYFLDKIYELVVHDVTKKVDDFTTGDEEESAKKMFLVGFWCIQTNPSERPPMSKVVEMLEGTIQSIQTPPKPILFCPNTLLEGKNTPSLSEFIDTEN